MRALASAADVPEIDESDIVKQYLPAISAPLLGVLAHSGEAELQARAQDVQRERAQLFSIVRRDVGDEEILDIDLRSALPDIDGFPISFTSAGDPVVEVARKIKPKRR